MLDSYGRPVSGTLGAISYWHATRPQYGGTCEIGFPDMLSKGPSLDRNPDSAQAGVLYFPLNLDGSFYPMPEGAIGIFPTRAPMQWADKTVGNDGVWEYFSDSWGLVYPDAQGWSFSLHRGKPLAAISSANGSEPRYRNMVRGTAGMFAAQNVADGRWRVFGAGAVDPMEVPGNFTDGGSAIAGANAMIASQRAAVMERERIRIAERTAREQAQTREIFAQARARGMLCQYRPPHHLSIAEIADFARACPGQFTGDDLARAQSAGLPADAIQAVHDGWKRRAQSEYRAQLAREESERNPVPRPYVPGAWSGAIAAAGDRIVADINRSSENWFDQRRKAYREEWQRKQRAY